MTPTTLIPLLVLTVLVLFVALVALATTARAAARRNANLIVLLKQDRDHWFATARRRNTAILDLCAENAALNENLGRVSTELAKFTGPRERGEDGRYVSTKVAA